MSDLDLEPRRTEIELYRCGCKHCDAAQEALAELARRHGALMTITRVDKNPDLRNLAGWRTPVVCVNGKQITHYEINAKKWEAALRERGRASPTMIVGEVVDMACFVKEGAKGSEHRKCAEACIQEGVPMGLATRSGELYLLVEDREAREPYQKLKKLASEQVRVTGEVSLRAGVWALVVKAVETEARRAGWPR